VGALEIYLGRPAEALATLFSAFSKTFSKESVLSCCACDNIWSRLFIADND